MLKQAVESVQLWLSDKHWKLYIVIVIVHAFVDVIVAVIGVSTVTFVDLGHCCYCYSG